VPVPPRRALRWILALYAVSAIGVALQRTLVSTENNFVIFRWAFRHLLAGEDLYAAYPTLHADFFKYSPTFAFLFAPFALPPAVVGYVLWALTCAGAVYLGITRLLAPRQAVIALALTWLAVVGDLQRAQSNALCAGLIILSWVAFERGKQVGAAAAIAAGVVIKLFPLAAFTGAVFEPKKTLRFALVFAVVLGVALALPLLAVSPHSLAFQYRSWLAIEARDALPVDPAGAGGAGLYSGIMGLLRVWAGVRWPFWPMQLAGVLVLVAPLALHWRDAWGDKLFRTQFLGSLLVFCVLFNHQAESPSYAIAMIGTAVWYAASERTWWRTALMAISIIIVNLGSTDMMPRVWYQAYYVTYLLKTVPLIPVWMAMQGELIGLVPNAGAEPASGGRRAA
jgi:hypothetical protein